MKDTTDRQDDLTMARVMLTDAEEQVRMGLCGLAVKDYSKRMAGDGLEIPENMISVVCTMDSSKITNLDHDTRPIADGELCVFTNRLPMIMTDINPHRDMLESLIGMANVKPIQTMAWFNALERCCDGQRLTDVETFEETLLSVIQRLDVDVIDIDHACLRGLISSLDVVGCIRTIHYKEGESYVFRSIIETKEWYETTVQVCTPTEAGGMFMHPLERTYNGDIEELEFRCLQSEGVMLLPYNVPVPVGSMKSFKKVQDEIRSIRSKVNAFVAMKERHQAAQQNFTHKIEQGLPVGQAEEE